MVQPKYSPEEALKVIKLRMNYDSSKTLTENVDSISILNEQETAANTANIARDIVGYLVGDVQSSDLTNIQNIVDDRILGKTFKDGTCLMKKVLEYFGRGGNHRWTNYLTTLSAFSGTGLDLIKAIQAAEEGGESEFEDIKKDLVDSINKELNGFCKTNSTETPQTSDTIPAAGKGFESLKRIKEIKDTVCTAKKDEGAETYTITIGGSKGLDLDRWAKRWGVTPQEIEDARQKCGKKDSSAAGGSTNQSGGSTSKPKYTPCEAGKYVRGCKSDVVKKVQACLGMPAKYHTGNFGPITQGELQKKFPELAQGFTDADVTKICSKTVTPVKPIQPKGETSVDDANSL
jgi:hypothetical protein